MKIERKKKERKMDRNRAVPEWRFEQRTFVIFHGKNKVIARY